ncbi:autotransporter-associated beta strand repeat-containing protein [Luteolibacter ambystomatis]|uniref:Autotransporter-associated beta strand repeat-containing protein n=1 Tax=Luteolibacter ambystomatis TaxID=2824561 RepID=A0A975J387_9BACT|nr:autotransporter-associated beta strand repeat-containing protein [Luteolibacter ambystomatis]QUE53176.1 autotransporter-associated beta strand repeat-containing protein [Luteolibacter ambystomatis]
MKPKSSLRSRLLQTTAILILFSGFTHAGEITVNSAVTDLVVNTGDSVWFDSTNTNAAISLATINSVAPATGPLPGWAHTQNSFVKYNGTQVLEIPSGEKVVGAANLSSATASSIYNDSLAATTSASNQSIGWVETTRDFLISNGATLNVANSGLMFSSDSHYVKVGTGSGFVTSSSGALALVANGGAGDYRVNDVVIKDFNGTTPLKVIKAGPDHLYLGATNTYTGGTWVNNGRLQANNAGALGTGTARVANTNGQIWLTGGGTYANAFEIVGNGWSESVGQLGALRLNNGVTLSGPVTLTGAARVAVSPNSTATITGALTGTAALEMGYAPFDVSGTLNLNGNASGYTGLLTISRGRLNVNTTLGGSVNVTDARTLGGTGTINGNLTVGTTAGATLALTPGSPLKVLGTATLNGPNKLTISTLPANGTYPVLNYGTLVNPSNLSIDNTLYRKTLAVDTSAPGVIAVTVSGSGLPLTWTGATNGNWDLNAGANWSAGAGNITFLQGDDVLFDETATAKTVTILGLLQPGSVTFNNSSTYTINCAAGNGITGPTGITKNGTGTVVLGGIGNAFTGPVQINAGIIKLNNWEPLGFTSGVTVVAGAAVDFNGNTPRTAGRIADYTIEGNGVDGLGALTNTGGDVNENSGVRNVTLTGDASVNGNTGRLDIGFGSGTGGITTGNNHTLTLNAGRGIGVHGNASGSPIHYVVASGRVWAQTSNNALGGTTGTVLVKSGARLGMWTGLTVPTPVTIENGGGLYAEGGGNGTWTGPISLSGAVTFDAGPNTVTVTGPVTGNASLTKTGAQTVTVAQPGYTGDTTVTAGTLSLGAATLADGSIVTIGGSAKLGLTHGQADTVGALFIGGVAMAPGTYGATGSGATNIDNTHFSGTGRLSVTTVATRAAIMEWRAEDWAGTGVWTDAISSEPATIGAGTPTVGSGTIQSKPVSTVQFNGSSGFASDSSSLLGNLKEFTVTAVIKVGATPGTGAGPDANAYQYNMITGFELGGANQGEFQFGFSSANTLNGAVACGGDFFVKGGAVTADEWKTVTMVVDQNPSGTDATKYTIETFINGVSQGKSSALTYATSSPGDAIRNSPFGIGYNVVNGADRRFFNGEIARLRFDKIALAPAQIAEDAANFMGLTADPYATWTNSYPGLVNPADKLKDADPDHDGLNNLHEFAFGGSPVSGATNLRIVSRMAMVNGNRMLTLTVPVRSGANFAGGPTATISGITYNIQASLDLIDWTSIPAAEVPVADRQPLMDAAVPAPAGYSNRFFYIPNSEANPMFFLRATVTEAQ